MREIDRYELSLQHHALLLSHTYKRFRYSTLMEENLTLQLQIYTHPPSSTSVLGPLLQHHLSRPTNCHS